MSIDSTLTRACPFLLENDVLVLSPRFCLEGLRLRDDVVGAEHGMQAPAEKLVRLLRCGATHKALLNLAADHSVQRVQLCELLGLLNTIGGLERQRSLWANLSALAIQTGHLAFGVRYQPFGRRQPASLRHISMATWRATLPITLGCVGLSSLLVLSGWAPVAVGVTSTAYWLTLLLASITLHEYAHGMLARLAGTKTDILQLGMRLGVVHKPLPARAEVVVTIGGPLAGLAVCLLAVELAIWLRMPYAALLALTVAAFHLLSLLPFYGDGKCLYKALRNRKGKVTCEKRTQS